MTMPRRRFLSAAAAAGLMPAALDASPSSRPPAPRRQDTRDRFDPWVEVDAEAIHDNVRQVSALVGGRPILAVVKNNAYGLDLTTTARILESLPEVYGFAVVKAEAAMALRDADVAKPVLHMGIASESDSVELARRGVQPSLFSDAAVARARAMARALGRPVDAHVYLDTGMGRMGMPYHRAMPWLAELAEAGDVRVQGTYMAFTEEPDFDPVQLERFETLAGEARGRGIELGSLHAASSSGVYELPEAHLDMVRPGIALYGSYPNDADAQRLKAELRCAFHLRARVVRVERLRAGDGVSYGRNYVAERPVWIATIPAGHVDGVPRRAVDGARVLIRNQTYPVIGAVSASHCIVELGDHSPVDVGDVVTLLGPDHADVVPDNVAAATGVSVYDLLMHLNPDLPRIVL
jgi:alanine racemase